MSLTADQELVREIISKNRYLSLATTDGSAPWVAPIEYMCDDRLNFYFLSTVDCRHSRHIQDNPAVAVAIYETTQPDYSPGLTVTIRGVQIQASAKRLSPVEHPDTVTAAIDALQPPMPPYAVFRLTPSEFYLPKLRNGVNERVRVDMG
jgi:uncharacterized protein YhbP (UPF0306 family)